MFAKRIHLEDGKSLPMPTFKEYLAEPKELLNKYLLEHPNIKKSAEFSSLYEGYISSDDAASSGSLFPGIALEWSAYIHGLNASRLRSGTIYRPYMQGEGLIFFMTSAGIYLDELEKAYPLQFKLIKSDTKAINLLRSLVLRSAQALKKINPCAEYKGQDSVLQTVKNIPFPESLSKISENSELKRLLICK